MAETGGEVVEVMVERLMPAGVGGRDTGYCVEFLEQGCGGDEVGGPIGVSAVDAVGAEKGAGGRASVAGFEAVNERGLDLERERIGGVIHG